MSGNTSGTYNLGGLLSGGTAGAAANQNPTGPVVYNISLLAVAQTFNIASNTNSSVIVNGNALGLLETFNLDTNGGTLSLGTGINALDAVNVTVDKGGTFIEGAGLLNALTNTSINYGTGGGTVLVGTAGVPGTLLTTETFSGFKLATDHIDDASLQFSGLQSYTITGTPGGIQTVTVNDSAGSFTFNTSNAGLTDGTYTKLAGGPLTFSKDGNGGTVISAVCFLGGTRIATPDGETPVEALAPGDLVATRVDGRTVFRPVTWVGRRSMDVSRTRGEIEAYPVRIRAGAFADNTPHRDLLVTSEHCVFADGRLVPARMLVNGGSIIVDTSVAKYEYFHVELEAHSILVAEGLETESYLDTGNRGNFANAAVPSLSPDFAVDAAHLSWGAHAAAPLAVDRETVEPIWLRLVERARALGLDAGMGGPLSNEPDLRLVTDAGLEIRPSLFDGTSYAFVVPGGARALRLVSKASRPSEAIGPFIDDRRVLGVLVGKVGLGVGRRRVAASASEYGPLAGWHPAEDGSAHRWTDGDATLPLDLSAWDGAPVFLDVEVVNAGPYLDQTAAALAA